MNEKHHILVFQCKSLGMKLKSLDAGQQMCEGIPAPVLNWSLFYQSLILHPVQSLLCQNTNIQHWLWLQQF